MVSLQSWAKSDIGRKRAANEDSFYQDPDLGLFMVADGMGGHRGGDRASRIAIETASETYREEISRGTLQESALKAAIIQAAKKVHQTGTTQAELKGMGTTLSAIVIAQDRALIAHIGDTRIYCWRNQVLHQLTRDHSLVNEQVEAGIMTKEEARVSSLRNIITRAIGHDENVQADYLSFPTKINDIFILCTDGLNNMLTDSEIGAIISAMPPREAIERLIDEANHKGGDDNISIILVKLNE